MEEVNEGRTKPLLEEDCQLRRRHKSSQSSSSIFGRNFDDKQPTWANEWLGITISPPISGGIFRQTNATGSMYMFHKPIRGINAKPRALYKDLIYILLNLKWSKLVLVLTLFYVVVTGVYALIFHFICHESDGILDAFNYSYQAFSTIGFGIVYPKNRCGNYFMITEMMVSMVAIPAMTGLVFSKFSLAKVRLALSQVGVVHLRYRGDYNALVFRVANASYAKNLHQDILMNVSLKLDLFQVEDLVGPRPRLRRYHLQLHQSEFLMLRLAMQVVHIIDQSSPLYGLHANDFNNQNYILQLTLHGIDSNRHATVVDQTLYSSGDIKYGFRFEQMMFPPSSANEAWALDFNKLNSVQEMDSEAPHKDELFHTAHHAPFHRSNSEPRQHLTHLETQFLAQTQPLIRMGNIDEEYSISTVGLYPSTIIEAKNAPYFFQYTYYHLLHLRWSRILLALTGIVLFTAIIFALLHCLKFSEGLFIAEGLQDVFTPFELTFFLSIHTLSTVGFGDIAPAPNDHFHNILVVIEALCGISLMAIVTGLAWSKFALPQAHIQFSTKVVATTIEGQRCIMFRAVNTRHLGDIAACEFKLGAYFEDRHGVRMMHDLKLVEPKWPSINIPVTLVHIIDEASPLSRYHFHELNDQHIVMLAVFSGFDTTFCETVYARHMYSEFEMENEFLDVVHLTAASLVVDWKNMQSSDETLGRSSNMM